jgi:hypothetical protein
VRSRARTRFYDFPASALGRNRSDPIVLYRDAVTARLQDEPHQPGRSTRDPILRRDLEKPGRLIRWTGRTGARVGCVMVLAIAPDEDGASDRPARRGGLLGAHSVRSTTISCSERSARAPTAEPHLSHYGTRSGRGTAEQIAERSASWSRPDRPSCSRSRREHDAEEARSASSCSSRRSSLSSKGGPGSLKDGTICTACSG